MTRVDEAYELVRCKCFRPQVQRCFGGFGCISLSVFRRSEHPAEFRNISDSRFHISLEIRKTNLTDKLCCFSFLDHPVPESENRPMTGVTKKACPALL